MRAIGRVGLALWLCAGANAVSAGQPGQTYDVFLPSQYRADRAWPLLMAFHPAARGRDFIDLYRDAAEDYGYIVVASNVSRNGLWAPSLAAAQAMTADVSARYSIDPSRFYTTGFSGGARVAMQLAITSGKIAGVIASGAGFPDAQARRRVSFDVAATIGYDDFNFGELRSLDRVLTSPHRVFYFAGGHRLPPPAVARQAIEWLELRAMVRGLRPKDDAVIDRWWQARIGAAEAESAPEIRAVRLQEAAEDFRGVRDVTEVDRRAKALLGQPEVRRALSRERDRDAAEARLLTEIATLEAALSSDDTHAHALMRLRALITDVHKKATTDGESPEGRSARRVLVAVTAGASERVSDPDYLKMVQAFRLR